MQTDTIPDIIKRAVQSLQHQYSWHIMESLIQNGAQTWQQLSRTLNNPNPNTLSFVLKELAKGALVDRYEQFGGPDTEKVTFDVSPYGKAFVNGLLSSLEPSKPKV